MQLMINQIIDKEAAKLEKKITGPSYKTPSRPGTTTKSHPGPGTSRPIATLSTKHTSSGRLHRCGASYELKKKRELDVT